MMWDRENRRQQYRTGEEETERNRTGKGLTGDIQRRKQKNTSGQDRK
jgi:hypothetical protein